ncbi:hypothetical protein DESHY_100002 [Desulforamulus hydrothermalis Lam5 = DSM 18033]|uniref:Uncharacterized protein n=1 Tax=Desulforamulus hydrothermalis Lam5 = DSM 18033 TaxID=1121428 RepID=K8EE30_9FIRM|nr:hypothetical protein DESHY_100002 [Desulforamulus hydrothermalis Lam5 = DSM 18033]
MCVILGDGWFVAYDYVTLRFLYFIGTDTF